MGTTIFLREQQGHARCSSCQPASTPAAGRSRDRRAGRARRTLGAGEIFGEMASLGRCRASASAVARSDAGVIGLDDAQFQTALGKDPGFALLLSIMAARLRETLARLDGPVEGWREAAALTSSPWRSRAGCRPAPLPPPSREDHHAGSRGARPGTWCRRPCRMRIGDTVVEKAGPGGIFGDCRWSTASRAWRPPWRKPAASSWRSAANVPVTGETQPEIRCRLLRAVASARRSWPRRGPPAGESRLKGRREKSS